MKKNEWKGFLKGVISTSLVFSMIAPTFGASGILEQIYVDKKPIKIMLDGKDNTPPSSTPAMIWNGSTYVPLRYLGEAMGKNVSWDGSTRTISINSTTNQPIVKQQQSTSSGLLATIDDPMTLGIESHWRDPQNGMKEKGQDGIHITRGPVILENVFPNALCDYTIEFETRYNGRLFDVYLGKQGYEYTNRFYTGGTNLYYQSADGENGIKLGSIDPYYDEKEYHKILLNVHNKQCDVFFDGDFIGSHKIEGEDTVSAFAFDGIFIFYSVYSQENYSQSYYVKNFKVY